MNSAPRPFGSEFNRRRVDVQNQRRTCAHLQRAGHHHRVSRIFGDGGRGPDEKPPLWQIDRSKQRLGIVAEDLVQLVLGQLAVLEEQKSCQCTRLRRGQVDGRVRVEVDRGPRCRPIRLGSGAGCELGRGGKPGRYLVRKKPNALPASLDSNPRVHIAIRLFENVSLCRRTGFLSARAHVYQTRHHHRRPS